MFDGLLFELVVCLVLSLSWVYVLVDLDLIFDAGLGVLFVVVVGCLFC